MANKFGGEWTAQKLAIIKSYLDFYTTALKGQPFKLCYIDAFAGTGNCETKATINKAEPTLFQEPCDQEAANFLEGSVQIALELKRPFDEYVFIEKTPTRYNELNEFIKNYSHLADRITIAKADANQYIKGLCREKSWKNTRAVLFLDPFGMQVEWLTLESIAKTQAIDLWFLCPINAMNRMLTSNGIIDPGWKNRLNIVFGTEEWYNSFYKEPLQYSIFGESSSVVKDANYTSITNYVISRLKTIFAGVSNKPKMLYNSKGQPLFSLCFAIGNPAPRAMGLALKAANHILDS